MVVSIGRRIVTLIALAVAAIVAVGFRKQYNSLQSYQREIAIAINHTNFPSFELDLDMNASQHVAASTTTVAPTTAPTTTNRFSNFLMHIPKSGTSYAMHAMGLLLNKSPEWKNLGEGKYFRACDEATALLRNFGKFRTSYKGSKCTMWMSEQPYSMVPEHVYAIVREPKSHVLSMYFHCLESKDHKKYAYKMPSLDDWLTAWVDAKHNTTKERENIDMHCYNPINFQSRWVGNNIKTTNTDTGTNSSTSIDVGTDQHLHHYQDLKNRFLVLGDNAQMDKSVCMIFIQYTGWVPKRCDCTSSNMATIIDDKNSSANASVTTSNATANADATIPDSHFAHGVIHHGNTFQATQSQIDKIAMIRDLDIPLYDTSRQIFRDQVRVVENKYNIKICDKLLPIEEL